MKDYSPLFNLGLFSLATQQPQLPLLRPPPAKKQRSARGRSFLHLKPSMNWDDQPRSSISLPTQSELSSTRMTLPSVSTSIPSYHSTSTSPRASCSTSSSRRLLPLPKPAPVSSLPDVPVPHSFIDRSLSCSSPTPSSAIQSTTSSTRRHTKNNSIAATFITANTHFAPSIAESTKTISTTQIKRQDALCALEGRKRGGSFVPNMLPEDDECASSLNLTFGSPKSKLFQDSTRSSSRTTNAQWLPIGHSHLSFGSTIPPTLSSSYTSASSSPHYSNLLTPSTPNFSIDYSYVNCNPFELDQTESMLSVGWASNFIDLEDDGASSLWRMI